MHKMAASLKLPLTEVEEIVATLISNGKMHARIDSQSKIIHSRETNERYNTIQKVINLTNHHSKEISKGILRLSLVRSELTVKGADRGASQPQHVKEDSYFDNNYIDASNEMSLGDM
jgi:hypothetical protein